MDQLRKDGWYINESQVADFFPDKVLPKTSNEILKTILDEDLRQFAEPSIVNLHRKEENTFQGPCVLQLLRYRNVSVPRIKEEMNQADPTHSIIRLFFTDGHTSISAMVLENIPGINAETPPGTKILLTGKVTTEGIFLVLNKNNVKILGGKVALMIEKWRFEKNSVRSEGYNAKSAAGKGTGAPKWVPFTKRNEKNIKLDKGFRANDAMPKNTKEGDEVDEFTKNREQVLKEASQVAGKTFTTPNVERPAPKEKVAPVPKPPKEPKPRKEFKRRGRKNSEDGPDVDVGEYANHKPSGPATLFDFIGGGGGKEASTSSGREDVVKLAEETSRMNVSGGPPQKSFGRGSGPRDHGKGAGSGPRGEPRRQGNERSQHGAPRNDNRPAKNYERSDGRQNHGSGAPKRENQRNDSRPNTGPPQHHQQQQAGGRSNRNDRPNTGPSHLSQQHQGPQRIQKNDHQNRNPGPPQHRSNNAPSAPAPTQAPARGRNNQRGNVENQNQEQPTYQRRPHVSYGPPDRRGNPGIQVNLGNHGNHPNQQRNDFQRGPPRGNQGRQAAPGPSLTFGAAPSGPQWRPGSQCLSTWTDGNLYPATVTAVLPDGNCVVRYNEYGNMQTIPSAFLIIP